jgi:hypothetical protein
VGFDTCRDSPSRGIRPFVQDKDEASQDKPKSEVRGLNTAFLSSAFISALLSSQDIFHSASERLAP